MSYLPHIYPEGATFFMTFRLADSLPQQIVTKLKDEYYARLKLYKSIEKDIEKINEYIEELRSEMFGKYDHQLDDKPYGDCYLKQEEVALILMNKIMSYDNQYYKLIKCCIMPNHVHMLMDTSIQLDNNTPIVQVGKWMQLIKGGSSREINKFLSRSGTLWNEESYDHYVRNRDAYFRIKRYIENNPLKAKLSPKFLKEPFLFG